MGVVILADYTKIFNLLTDMRGPANSTARNKKNDKFFQDCVNDAWNTLDIEKEQLCKAWEILEIKYEYPKGKTKISELTKYQKLILLEALIIEATTRAIVPTKRDGGKVAVRRRDVFLLSMGLLEKYYHTAEDGTYHSAAERHESYIQKEPYDFIAITFFSSSLPNNYNVDADQKKAKTRIAKDDERCRKLLAKYLSKEGNCQNCLEEGVRKHIVYDDQNARYQIKLPSPCYTLENFPYVEPAKDTTDKSKDSGDYNKPVKTENDGEEDGILNFLKELLIDLFRKWFNRKANRVITFIVIAFITFFILLKVFANNQKNVAIDMAMKIIVSENEISNAPPVADDALANAVSFKDETAPDVESFNIREKEFPLYPGYSKRLDIEQIYPSNANEFSITYEFVPPGLLKVENNYITALNDVPIGNTSVDVIVKATGHAEIVHITIQNPDEKDEISQGGPFFEHSQ